MNEENQPPSTAKFAKKKVFRKKESREISIDHMVQGIKKGDRMALSRGITLVESQAKRHRDLANNLVHELLPNAGNSLRIGVTGVPGAGKSTWIESFGKKLVDLGNRVAILAIDPSSTLSGGSILGDKTRMEQLSHHPNVFIRPSATAGTLGGVHRMTRETIVLCEAAGFDRIIVETVGVGQSEVVVRGMVDFFMLLALTGGGDELQGMKKGIMELVDAVIVNKADGNNKEHAIRGAAEYKQLLHYVHPATPGWETKAFACSAIEGFGMDDVYQMTQQFYDETLENGVLKERRAGQSLDWMKQMIHNRLLDDFLQENNRSKKLKDLQLQVKSGDITPAQAVEMLFLKE
ncbi:methylmalonyl Co-A mutase-associated GTPase MeaB [Jeotgalibacillus soli]|uniref:Transporter n=1 Tax=Jeotgalibacillus soli TaxID=889306 RepID=A0A0C2VJZ1_9BACL|nr:methylmalonyl Co-A mutase-associated GTPase MeaB [Jeotgalibacillus soli]KIL44313.1 transporter [Jeotgalibacillus soli]